MEASTTQIEAYSVDSPESPERKSLSDAIPKGVIYALYGLAAAVSISLWFIAIRAPLWLDETHSYYVIKKGLLEIFHRQGWPGVPVYSYILWLWSKIAGTGELNLRILSVLAMLAAAYLLYCAAQKFFDTDVAIITAILFCLHPIVIFTSIDVRPYAPAALSVSAAIYVLARLRNSNSLGLAALFGLLCSIIVYVNFMFGATLPALALGFFVVKSGDRKNLWRQLAVALGTFSAAFLLAIPGLLFMLRTSRSYVWDTAPPLSELGWTLAPGWLLVVLTCSAFLAAATRKLDVSSRINWRLILLCASLGLIPILILYVISIETPLHIFTPRYRLVAIPGIAFCWGWIISRFASRGLRLLFCLAIVAATSYQYLNSPFSRQHSYSWKYALVAAEKSASVDNAPVLICSDFAEADHATLPVGDAVKDNGLYAPLSYYTLSVPVVALPRALNEQTMRIGSQFLLDASTRRQRFLAMAYAPSYPTLQWLAYSASGEYTVRSLGVYDDVIVLEFLPIHPATASSSP